MVKQAALHFLHEDSSLEEDIQRRLEASERGDFADSAHVWANVEKILRPAPQDPPADEQNSFASYRGALPAFQTKEQINNWIADLRND